jgi:hypothetical protein
MREALEHIWARNTDPNATKRSGNVSFTGMRAYSWNTVIACKYPNKDNSGGTCVFAGDGIRNSGYTMGHKSAFRMALPQGWTTINVELTPMAGSYHSLGGALADIKGLRECHDHMKFPLDEMADAVRKAKSYGSRAKNWKDLSRYLHNLNKLSEFLKRKVITPDDLGLNMGEENANLTRWNVSVASRPEPKPRTGVIGSHNMPELPEYIDKWRAGKRNIVPYSWQHTYLRLSKDKTRVETSRGAVVSVEQAEKLFALCTLTKGKDKTFNCSELHIHVGPYTLDYIDSDGDCRVGCHQLEYTEMEKLHSKYEVSKKG